MEAARTEQLFVNAQMASDGVLLSLLVSLQKRLNELVPRLSAVELKEQVSKCKSAEEKTAMIQSMVMSVLLHTGVSVYAVSALALALKTTYAVTAASMVKSQDPAKEAAAAEELATRMMQHLLEHEDGLAALALRLRAILENILHQHWPVRRPCSLREYQDLWRNVRAALEDYAGSLQEQSSLPDAAQAVRSSVLKHCFPFSADGALKANDTGLAHRVDAALSQEAALNALNSVSSLLFQSYFDAIASKFDPAAPVPLVRIVPLVQAESNSILLPTEGNKFLVEALLKNDTLSRYLRACSGMNELVAAAQNKAGDGAEGQQKTILFVCPDNRRESVAASALAKVHGGQAVQVHSCAASTTTTTTTEVVPQQSEQEVAALMALLASRGCSIDTLFEQPKAMQELPQDVVYDVVVLCHRKGLPPISPSALSVPSKRRIEWSFDNAADLHALVSNIEVRVKALLIEL